MVGLVDVAFTVTVAFAVVEPPGLVAERVYVVETDGVTVIEELDTRPMPLSILVELAFPTTHESVALCPAVIEEGAAVKDVMVGAACATVAEQVEVATVEDASVA